MEVWWSVSDRRPMSRVCFPLPPLPAVRHAIPGALAAGGQRRQRLLVLPPGEVRGVERAATGRSNSKHVEPLLSPNPAPLPPFPARQLLGTPSSWHEKHDRDVWRVMDVLKGKRLVADQKKCHLFWGR